VPTAINNAGFFADAAGDTSSWLRTAGTTSMASLLLRYGLLQNWLTWVRVAFLHVCDHLG
jgi:hypothetical protein